MSAVGSRDGREIVRTLEELRAIPGSSAMPTGAIR